jgi:hypothetical protein
MMVDRMLSRRGLFFTIDALIAALIMIAGLLLMTSSYASEQPTTLINHMSQDMLNVLSELTVAEVNNSLIWEMYTNGSINDLNSTLIVQIGDFWANNQLVLANEFARNVSEGMFDSIFGYSIAIDNETLYTRTNPTTNSLVTSKKIVSGIQKSKPVKGFVSKARAMSINKVTTQTVSFSPEGSGWDGTDASKAFVYVTKYFNITPGTVINNATFYISLHLEDGGSNWDVFRFNDNRCIIYRSNLTFDAGEEGLFNVRNISGCLVNGTNKVVVKTWNDGYNSHFHPGMYIALSYNVTENVTYLATEHSERIYFDNVLSVEANNGGSGAWAMLPFSIPPGAANISAKLHLTLREVNDLKDRYWSGGIYRYRDAWDYRVYVNSDTVFFQDNATAYDDIDDCIDYSAACGTNYNVSRDFDMTGSAVTGTNVVSVYVNNYGDTVGGDGNTVIFSNWTSDPANSSYVELNYSLTPAVPYGVVELRQMKQFGGSPNPTKDVNFTFPSEAVAISSVYAHVAEQYSYITRVYGDDAYVPANLVFESPSPRAVPTDVYIPANLLDVSELVRNYLRVTETSGNDVRPESTADYGFYIPSFVGYGSVFATEQQASDDALSRLQSVMGSFVNISQVQIDNTSMSDVPSMWGPAVIEVRVWN